MTYHDTTLHSQEKKQVICYAHHITMICIYLLFMKIVQAHIQCKAKNNQIFVNCVLFSKILFFYFISVYERKHEVYLPMNGVNNDWLPVEAEAHQSWPPKNKKTDKLTKREKQRKKEKT